MTELEQHLLASLEKLESDLKTNLEENTAALRLLDMRVVMLEKYAPELEALCKELENTLRRLNSSGAFRS